MLMQTLSRGTIAIIVSAATFCSASLIAPAQAQVTPLVSAVSLDRDEDMCLDISQASRENGADAIVWGCHYHDNQQFELRPTEYVRDEHGVVTRWYEIRPLHSKGAASGQDMCLDVQGGSLDNGADVILWVCNGGWNQQWRMDASARLVARHSSKCLDVRGAGGWMPGTDVIQWTCNDGMNQLWIPAAGLD